MRDSGSPLEVIGSSGSSENLLVYSHADRARDTMIPAAVSRLDDGLRTCPTCKGTGINPVWPTKVCPKCDGERRIPPRKGYR